MFAVIPWIASLLGSVAGFVVKHPLVLKMMFFPFFVSIIMYAVTFISDMVQPYIVSNTAMALAAYYGVFDALSLLVSILAAGFLVRAVIRFVSS